MGLDMYLTRSEHKYLLKNGSFSSSINDYANDNLGVSNTVDLKYQIAYWRKANQIHNWFVKHIQKDKDDCGSYYVGIESLYNLYDICKNILNEFDGVKFTIIERVKAFYDKENSVKEKGNKKFKYVNSFTFNANKLNIMFKHNLFNYEFLKKNNDAAKIEKLITLIKSTLPPRDGFFFGSTNIDGGYVYDLIITVLMFDRIFKQYKLDNDKHNINYHFEYSSSW